MAKNFYFEHVGKCSSTHQRLQCWQLKCYVVFSVIICISDGKPFES